MDNEYKVVSESHIEKLIERLNTIEADWEIIETIQEHGFTKVILRRTLGNNMTADLSSLLALVTDPKAVKDNIEALKKSLDESRQAGLEAQKATISANDLFNQISTAKADLDSKQKELSDFDSAVSTKKELVDQRVAELAYKTKDLESRLKATEDKLKARQLELEATVKSKTDSLQELSNKLSLKEQELIQREAFLVKREDGVAKKEASVADVQAKANEFLGILGKRV